MKQKTAPQIATITALIAAALLLSTVNSQLSTAFAQGSLTPPGPPGPMYKTLGQIEPRTAITNSGAVTISQSGSYYLTTNITVSSGDAISITANNVTLDLNGFTIASTRPTAASDSAILFGALTNIAIYNGNISSGVTYNGSVFAGGGFGYGIYCSAQPRNVRVKNVSVTGVLLHGIDLGTGCSTMVESCAISVAGGYGIDADSVSDSTALTCGSFGIYADTAHNCTAYGVGTGNGLVVTTANNCSGYSSGSGYGLETYAAQNCYGYSSGSGVGCNGNTVVNCYGYSSGSGNGVSAVTASDCQGYSASGNGITANAAQNCYGRSDGNSASGINANTAVNCTGSNPAGGTGLSAAFSALNCYGTSTSGAGLYSGGTASHCYGQSSTGSGILARVITGCTGTTSGASSYGLSALVVTDSFGDNQNNGIGVSCTIANTCYGNGSNGVSTAIANSCVGPSIVAANK